MLKSKTVPFGAVPTSGRLRNRAGVQRGRRRSPDHDEPVHLPEHRPPAVAVNFPPEWCDRYFERKYHEIDPVVSRTPTFSGPFFCWIEGECVGLVGESGSGKTTTSRLIAKLIKPTAGSIQLSGEEIADADPRAFAKSAKRRLVQIVFQDPAASLDPGRTAFEAIADPLQRLERIRRPAELARRVKETCDLVDFPHSLLARYPHQLSGGQKARVGIARAISVNPALVVLDEPTSALDVSAQAVVLNQLDKLKRALGLSYLFVSTISMSSGSCVIALW
jgi:ABC-type dipeptide/oligopeptide/nickel transport system ATPase subunit